MFVAKNILTHQPEELFATNQDHAMAHKELVRLDFCRKQMIFLENEVSTWIWTRALSRFGKMPKLQIFYWDQWLGSSFLRFGSSFLGRHTDWELRHIPSRLSQISVLFAFNQYHFDCQRNAASQGAIDIHSSHICVILFSIIHMYKCILASTKMPVIWNGATHSAEAGGPHPHLCPSRCLIIFSPRLQLTQWYHF